VHASSATPTFVVANHLWLTEIGRRAHEAGCKVVLAGFHGNSSISFAGNGGVAQLLRGGKWSRAFSHLKRVPSLNSRTLFRYALHAMLGDRIYALLNEQRNSLSGPFSPPGALFVRPNVGEYYSHRPIELTPVMQRRDWMHFITRPKTSFAVDIKAHAGIEFRDPTSDRRLCEYLLGCPTDAFVGEGFERLQARLLGAGHVPDSIRWRRTLGDQVPEQAGFFSLYPDRYRDAWEQVRCLSWTEEFIDVSASNRVFEDLVNGRSHPRLLASALHRILDIGTFIIDAKRRWQVTT
jgi:asparagine synthase (glutamine-hydrolysing)